MEEEVLKWVEKKDSAQLVGVKRAGEFFSSFIGQSGDCIVCGRDVSICSKCYSLSVHKSLRRNGILASEFLEFASGKGFMLSSKKGVLNLQR